MTATSRDEAAPNNSLQRSVNPVAFICEAYLVVTAPSARWLRAFGVLREGNIE